MKIRNLDRLKKKIAAMSPAARASVQAALVTSGEEIADLARTFAPKKSGDLARSIGTTVSPSAGHDLLVTVHAGDDQAYYARMVEFGTAPHVNGGTGKGTQHPGTHAQPFFFPAYRLGKKRAKARISRAMNKAAKKVAAGA